MLDAVVHVTAPSRLHFGLLSFGQPEVRQFGGVGVMLDSPGIELRVHPDRAFATEGPHADRVAEFARRWSTALGLQSPPACRVQVLAAPPEHVGLGLGTQLALAVARALNAITEVPEFPIERLATLVGRGQRSAVGTYGFAHGGMVVDRGKYENEAIAPPADRISLSRDWRFVLVRPLRASGLSGEPERTAFARLPPVPLAVTASLEAELREQMIPAALRSAFDDFSESLFRYGRMAGECFAAIQGGPYNGLRLERLVNSIRDWGVLGVGQSSWGPTIFALVQNQHVAADLAHRLHQYAPEELETITAAINYRGAQTRIE